MINEVERVAKYKAWVISQTNCKRCGKLFSFEEQRWEWVGGFLCTKCFKEHLPIALNRLNQVLAKGGGDSI